MRLVLLRCGFRGRDLYLLTKMPLRRRRGSDNPPSDYIALPISIFRTPHTLILFILSFLSPPSFFSSLAICYVMLSIGIRNTQCYACTCHSMAITTEVAVLITAFLIAFVK